MTLTDAGALVALIDKNQIPPDFVVKSQAIDVAEVMTLPQSGRLDGGEQPQGLPDARAQRLFAATVFLSLPWISSCSW